MISSNRICNRLSGNVVQLKLSQWLSFFISPMSLHSLSIQRAPILERALVLISLAEPHSVCYMLILPCNHKIAVLISSTSRYFAIGDRLNVKIAEDHLVLYFILTVMSIPALFWDDKLELEVPLRTVWF